MIIHNLLEIVYVHRSVLCSSINKGDHFKEMCNNSHISSGNDTMKEERIYTISQTHTC